LTCVGIIVPVLSRTPGPTAITVASGRGLLVAEVGRKMPEAVFYRQWLQKLGNKKEEEQVSTVSGLKRCTRTLSRRGMTDLMDLKVACAAYMRVSCRSQNSCRMRTIGLEYISIGRDVSGVYVSKDSRVKCSRLFDVCDPNSSTCVITA
jgi:hypothetical protein